MKRKTIPRVKPLQILGWLGIILLCGLLFLSLKLFSHQGECNPLDSITWSSYHNSRFEFGFPYPQNWTASTKPSNSDGLEFIDPKNPTTQIRGWAGNKLNDFFPNQSTENFTTKQGKSGTVTVEIQPEISQITLNINQESVSYYWQGIALSKDFGKYYQLFDYIIKNYQIFETN
jgi:hypothetical protein